MIRSADGQRTRMIAWGNGRMLDFSHGPLIMGILNSTPDSFYPGSRCESVESAVNKALDMIRDGAHMLDIGGESTRPGSDPVGIEEELARILPVIEGIRKRSEIIISVDTRKRIVAEQAIAAGADMVNDISGLNDDPGLATFVAEHKIPVILMHMRGTPKTMQQNPSYEHTIDEVLNELSALAKNAICNGINEEYIILDPGIGFGKRISDNLLILKHLSEFKKLGYPLLIGLSRKSFLQHICNRSVEERLAGSLAANQIAVQNGADILRVHDVRETVDMLNVVRAIVSAEQQRGS